MKNKIVEQTIEKKLFLRQVLTLAVPIALQNLINVGVQSADVIMLGSVGEVVLSGASLAGQMQFILMLILFGLASGASVLTAQYWGRGDTRIIEKVLGMSMTLSLALSVLFFVVGMLFPTEILRLFTPDEAVVAEGATYLRIISVSYLFIGFTSTYLNLMRSIERAMVATVVYFISFCTNIVLNSIFIFGLLGLEPMGIAGAALGSTLARLLELIIVAIYASKNTAARLRLTHMFHWSKTLLKDFMRYSLPTTINELCWGVGISISAGIVGHLGAAAVAANSVTGVTRQLAMVVCFGLATTAAIIMGKAIGAGEEQRALAYSRYFVRITMTFSLCGSLIILLIRPIILQVMNLSPEAHDYLSFLLYFLCFFVVAQAFNALMVVGICRSGGDTRFGLILDLGTLWGFSLLTGFIAAFVLDWPVKAVFVLLYFDEMLKIPFCIWRLRSRKWLCNVTRDDIA